MTIVFQSFPTQKTIFDLLHLLAWTSLLVLASHSYLLSSRSQIPSNPASPDEPPSLTLLSPSQPPTINTDVAPSILIGSQLPISPPEVSQSEDTSELPPFSSFLSDVRPLLSRPNQLKLRPDAAVLGRQHRREYYKPCT